jgi:phytanoyl-CoA hydroxylase
VTTFADDGFVVARGIADETRIEQLRSVIAQQIAEAAPPVELEADLHYPGAPASHQAPGGQTTRRLLQAYARDAVFREWAGNAAVVHRVRQLLGPAVMLSQAHHNCIMTKQPRYSSATGWHRDIRYWHFQSPRLVSVWLALGNETPDNGCLSFIPGSHRLDIPPAGLDEFLFLREDLEENRALLSRRVTPRLQAGDAVFFHCNTYHSAGSNKTDAPKVSLVFTYHTADNPAVAGTRSASLPSIPLST